AGDEFPHGKNPQQRRTPIRERERRPPPAVGGADGQRWASGDLWDQARAFRHRRGWRRSRGAGGRADRLGTAGRRQDRRRGYRRGGPRKAPIQAGRKDPAQTRPPLGALVGPADGPTSHRLIREESIMTMFTRRTLVQSTLATGALAGSGLLEWAKAWAQAAPWKPEKGAQLSLLRW